MNSADFDRFNARLDQLSNRHKFLMAEFRATSDSINVEADCLLKIRKKYRRMDRCMALAERVSKTIEGMAEAARAEREALEA